MTKKKSEKCKYFDGIFGKYDKNVLSLQQNKAGKSFPFLLLYGEKRSSTKAIKVLFRQKSEGIAGCFPLPSLTTTPVFSC